MNRETPEKIDTSELTKTDSLFSNSISEAPTQTTTRTMSIREMYESSKAERDQFNESTGRTYTCCLCDQPSKGFGNNPAPLRDGRCCDECNFFKVIPARMAVAQRDALARRLRSRIEAQSRQRTGRR